MTKTWPFCEFRADGSLVICNYGEHGEMQTLYLRPDEINEVASWLIMAIGARSLSRQYWRYRGDSQVMKATQRETLTGMFIDAPSPHRPVVRTSILAHQAHGGFTGRKQLVFEALRSYDARFLPTSAELANALPAQPDADRTAMLLLARRGLSDTLGRVCGAWADAEVHCQRRNVRDVAAERQPMRTRLTVEMLLLNALPLALGVCWLLRGM